MEKDYTVFIENVKFNVHEVFSPLDGFDDVAEDHVKNFKNLLLSNTTKDMREGYIKVIQDFPKYKENTGTEGTQKQKADRFMSLIMTREIGDITRAIEAVDVKDRDFYYVALGEAILRDIEIIKGDGKTYMSHFNYDLDCACAHILRGAYASSFPLGDYFARYIIANNATPLKLFA